ncbi:MAG: DEAD/DEAH box helicase [Limnochordaceae bacterium]|nr:DEAD/DEAH box helicase [Limnochordaceae bacterium]
MAAYFRERFGAPTLAQRMAWPAIRSGRDTLVAAPTGSGKTLAAFLVSLDDLIRRPVPSKPALHTLYVSPLRALSHDIHRSLELPLRDLQRLFVQAARPFPPIDVGVRTSDTPPARRRAMATKPPHILVTTPESLLLMMLAPRMRPALASVRRVIVDELHALLPTKRGALLALCLELLDELAGRRVQRIGLSATIRPLEEAARFLTGTRQPGAEVVDAGARRTMDLQVILPAATFPSAPEGTIWPSIARRLVDLIESHRSTLVFVNNRRQAERLTHLVNELAGRRLALTHHGSMARASRLYVEQALKAGELKAVVATATLELGIDVGFIDLVVHVESPPEVSQGLQRVGRSGHAVHASAKGRILPKHPSDLLEAAACARAIARFDIEPLAPVRQPADVLAQFVAGAATIRPWREPELLALVRRTASFSGISEEMWHEVLGLLAGETPGRPDVPVRPRIAWDRRDGAIRGIDATRTVLYANAGTIPDRGTYPVYLSGTDVRLGELDEEFVYETRRGDVFWLGMGAWRVEAIRPDRVLVSRASGVVAKVPFWRGEGLSRSSHLGRHVATLLEELEPLLAAGQEAAGRARIRQECHADDDAAGALVDYLTRQLRACGTLPGRHRVVVESFPDELGDRRLAIHSPLGRRLNQAWALAQIAWARRHLGLELDTAVADDGILLRLPGEYLLEDASPLVALEGEDPESLIDAELPGTHLVAQLFREAAGRALLITRPHRRRRLPLWQQRLRAADLMLLQSAHGQRPGVLVREALREARQDVLDVTAMAALVRAIRTGEVEVRTVTLPAPSPFAASLLFQFTATFLYEPDAPKAERQAAVLMGTAPQALQEAAAGGSLPRLLHPDAIREVSRRRAFPPWLRQRPPRSLEEMDEWLRHAGDVSDDELAAMLGHEQWPTAREWLERLAEQGRVTHEGGLWIHEGILPLLQAARREEGPEAQDAARMLLERKALAGGPLDAEAVARRYGLSLPLVERALMELVASGDLVHGVLEEGGPARFVATPALVEIRRLTLIRARQLSEPISLAAFLRFLAARHGLVPREGQPAALFPSGTALAPDAAAEAARRLMGWAAPYRDWLRALFPVRLGARAPQLLAAAVAAGRLGWLRVPASPRAGAGGEPKLQGAGPLLWTVFPRAELPLVAALFGTVSRAEALDPGDRALLEALGGGGSWFPWELAGRLGLPEPAIRDGLTRLVRQGLASAEAMALVERLGAERLPAPQLLESRPRPLGPAGYRALGRRMREAARERARLAALRSRQAAVSMAGDLDTIRFYGVLPLPDGPSPASAWARALMERYGVVARELHRQEGVPLPWAHVAQALEQQEARGVVVRGYFVEGLSGEQFAPKELVDVLREWHEPRSETMWAASLRDPVLLPLHFGAPPEWWPPGPRAEGAWCVLADGVPVLLVQVASGSLWFAPGASPQTLVRAARLFLERLTATGQGRRLVVRSIQGRPVGEARKSGEAAWLKDAGFIEGPQTLEHWLDPFSGGRPTELHGTSTECGP